MHHPPSSVRSRKGRTLSLAYIIVLLFHSPVQSQQADTSETDKRISIAVPLGQTTIGGYGEIHYGYNTQSKDARVNLTRFVMFLSHSFTDNITFKSELEVEDAKVSGGEDGGEVALEQAYLDFLISQSLGIRAGLFLPAIGIINETHEPPTFNGVERPYLETKLIPATWREIGIGVFGRFVQVDGLAYKLSLVNGLQAKGFGGDTGIREGRFEGRDANENSVAVTGKLEYANEGLKLGGSFYYGGASAGDTSLASGPFGTPISMVVLDVQYNYRNLYCRGVGATIQIPDAGRINALYGSDIGELLSGYYAELAYNLMPHIYGNATAQLLPFLRYENVDLHASVAPPLVRNNAYHQTYVVMGLTYKPVNDVVVKGDYTVERNKARMGQTNFIRMGLGYNF